MYAHAQDWSPFASPPEPRPANQRSISAAPTTASSWRVTVLREPGQVPVAASDPTWSATVLVSKAPLLVSNPIPRAQPRTVNPITGASHALDGVASYYWQDQMTASGERFDKTAMTAAHRTLPLNTRVRVTNVVNGRSVVVRINDRGPYKHGRILDLSEAAAGVLDMHKNGVAPVKVQVISN
jgi:rare lipoprotein A (peptidoglycan hydrolase)